MMKQKRILASLIAVLTAAGMLTGCSGGGNAVNSGSSSSSASSSASSGGSSAAGGSSSSASTADNTSGGGLTEPGTFPISETPLEFKVVTQQVDYILDYSTNDFVKWYEDKTNIKINWETVPSAAAKEKLNLILASNNLPDAFLGVGFNTTDQVVYGSQGSFINLKDYIDSVGVFTKAAINESKLNSVTAPDGSIYALPAINACYHCFYSGRAWINNQWLENLGLSYPNTTEEFYNVLKAFKEQDANGNGNPNDEIPMMGCADGWNTGAHEFLLNSFVYNDYGPRLHIKDGKIEFVANTEDFREGLKYVRKLVAENLLDPVSLTQTGEQFKIIGGNPDSIDIGVVAGATWWSGLGDDGSDTLKRSRQYTGLSPLEGPKGVRYVLTNTSDLSIGQFVITSQCSNPEALFRWADGMYDEEVTFRSQLGTEGVGWSQPTEGALGINGKPALYKTLLQNAGDGETRNDWMSNIALGNRTSDFRLGEEMGTGEEEKWNTEPRLYSETKTYFEPYAAKEGEYVPSLILTSEESDERTALETQITDYVKENIVAFLAGNRDLDKEWDSYVKEFDVLGLPRYLELMQSAYDRQYGGK